MKIITTNFIFRLFLNLILFIIIFVGNNNVKPQILYSISTTGLLIGKGAEVKGPHHPVSSDPVLAPLSHSAPISASEVFMRRRRK
uniref:Uncharacterized protein n=1 Tax=Meloidogyne incognita TaxID=6306 RepID=A0A914LP08_MELIC